MYFIGGLSKYMHGVAQLAYMNAQSANSQLSLHLSPTIV